MSTPCFFIILNEFVKEKKIFVQVIKCLNSSKNMWKCQKEKNEKKKIYTETVTMNEIIKLIAMY